MQPPKDHRAVWSSPGTPWWPPRQCGPPQGPPGGKYNDYDLIRIFLSRQNEEEEWRRQIEKTIERAEINKEDLLIFYVNLDENSFAYRQQDLISRLYTDVLENTKLETRGYGWDQLFSFDAVNIFIFLLILAGAVVIFLSDVGRPALILRVSKNGRGRTAIAKIVALLCWAILSVFLVLLTIGVAVYLKCIFRSFGAHGIFLRLSIYAVFPYRLGIPLDLLRNKTPFGLHGGSVLRSDLHFGA